MNIELANKHIFEFVNALPLLFGNVEIQYEFGENRPFIGDDSVENFRGMLGGHSVGFKSGLYLFSNQENEIIYIGKATKNNLHSRTTSHVGVPKRTEAGWMTFPSTEFSECSEYPELVKNIRDGKIRLHVFTVSDATLISLLEVYMQTMYLKNVGRLPYFNKQIG